jgi:hypothetical protein
MSVYCISFPEARWSTEIIIVVFFPMVISQRYGIVGAAHIPEVSLGQVNGGKLRALVGTLGGAALLVAGLTTLRSCDEFRDSLTREGT